MYPKFEAEEKTKIFEKDLEEFENYFKIELSIDYKSFMLENNGGSVENKYLYYLSNEDDYMEIIEFKNLEILYESQKLVEEYEDLNLYKKNKMLRIGDYLSGNSICLCYSNENIGKIYYIDDVHDDKFILIANSFDEFINGFEYNPDL